MPSPKPSYTDYSDKVRTVLRLERFRNERLHKGSFLLSSSQRIRMRKELQPRGPSNPAESSPVSLECGKEILEARQEFVRHGREGESETASGRIRLDE